MAVALTIGNSGYVAAAFDKREQVQLVLAKNGPPTLNDVATANELISLIWSPAVSHVRASFSLHMSIRNELRTDFPLALKVYEPDANIKAEFPGAGSLLEKYGDAAPPTIAIVWDCAGIFFHADALKRSRFLKSIIEDRNLRTNDRKRRAEKLKRRLAKVCRYVNSISHLIQKAKRYFQIPHNWVIDTFVGTGECVFNLCDNAYDAVSRGFDYPSLSPEIVDKLDKHFPSIRSKWENNKIYTHVFTLNFVSFFTLVYHRQ